MSGVSARDVSADEAGMRLDRWFKRRYPAITHGRLQKMLRKGEIRVDGGRAKADTRLEQGAEIRVPPLGDIAQPAKPKAQRVSPEDAAQLQEMVLYKDD